MITAQYEPVQIQVHVPEKQALPPTTSVIAHYETVPLQVRVPAQQTRDVPLQPQKSTAPDHPIQFGQLQQTMMPVKPKQPTGRIPAPRVTSTSTPLQATQSAGRISAPRITSTGKSTSFAKKNIIFSLAAKNKSTFYKHSDQSTRIRIPSIW